MRRIISSNFEIDITKNKVTEVDENNWFLDDFRLKITFPFDLDLTDELDEYFQQILEHNSTPETLIPVFYNHYEVLESGELEIEEKNGRKLSASLTYGLEQLPSWEKKLSELSLDKFELVGETIYEHAKDIITLGWPAVNYNFPQVHIEKIDITSDDWFAFEQRINLYRDNNFVENYVDVIEDITYNKNIMQPLAYWLHLLKRGAADAGLELAGDIINDQVLQKTLVYADVDYYTSMLQESQSIMIMSEDAQNTGSFPPYNLLDGAFYNETITIVNPGKYRLIGKVYLKGPMRKENSYLYALGRILIKYKNKIIVNRNLALVVKERSVDINVVFETDTDILAHELNIQIFCKNTTDELIAQLDINPIRLHDMSGDPIPTIINLNQIDLTRAVPDVTFGEFMKITKNWFNYDWNVQGNQLVMNLIEDEIHTAPAFDLSNYEVKNPNVRYNKGTSFILKFADADVKEFGYQILKMYKSASETSYLNEVPEEKINEKTNQIDINGLPLPMLFRNQVQTAHAFTTGNDKVYAVMYDGLQNGLNLCASSAPLELQEVVPRCFDKWFNLRINAKTYKWIFYSWHEELIGLKSKSLVFCYNKWFIAKRIQKKEIKPNLYEVDIEIDSIE